MRLMMEDAMAKVIEFYIPGLFPKKVNCMTRTEGGKVIEFRLPSGKAMQFREPPSREPSAKERALPMWTFCF